MEFKLSSNKEPGPHILMALEQRYTISESFPGELFRKRFNGRGNSTGESIAVRNKNGRITIDGHKLKIEHVIEYLRTGEWPVAQ